MIKKPKLLEPSLGVTSRAFEGLFAAGETKV
jgi:hypothetical protein